MQLSQSQITDLIGAKMLIDYVLQAKTQTRDMYGIWLTQAIKQIAAVEADLFDDADQVAALEAVRP